MNIAVILAAGVDPNFQMNIPKQFVNVNNRPVVVYTMEQFQKHPEIDAIMVACLAGWEKMIEAYARQFGIDKLQWIITGGSDGQETSRLATEKLVEVGHDNDVIILHDGIRPLVTEEIISDSIRVCRKNGMGIAAVYSMDNVMLTDGGKIGMETIPRHTFRRIQTPQTYRLGDLKQFHEEAATSGVHGQVDTNNMVSRLGKQVSLSKGADLNIKINTVEDVEMFKVLYGMVHKEEEQ